ncbi:MAG: hypothetical protein ABIT09_02005 [Croceibacterium sp.]
MTSNARLVVFALGALALAAGVMLMMLTGGGGIGLTLIGAAVIASVALERRYGQPGAPTNVPLPHFEPTRERFVDHETDRLLEVWVDPLTGERRYEPAPRDDKLIET